MSDGFVVLGVASLCILLAGLCVLLVSFVLVSEAKLGSKVLRVNSIGTFVVLMVLLLSSMSGSTGVFDVALVYVSLSFVSMVAFLRFLPGSSF